jgi:hypothetical protein
MAADVFSEYEIQNMETTATIKEYEDGRHKLAFKGYLRSVTDNDGHTRTAEYFHPLAPRFFIFSYRGGKAADDAQEF